MPKRYERHDLTSPLIGVCREIPHPGARHAAEVMHVLADEEAEQWQKGLALASLAFWML